MVSNSFYYFEGKYFYCSIDTYSAITEELCKKAHGVWGVYAYNFDNTLEAMRSLFVISTLDNWIQYE